MDVPSIPSRQHLSAYADRSWRRFMGFSTALFLAILPELSRLIVVLMPGVEEAILALSLEAPANIVLHFLREMTIQLVLAVFLVYFLRVLYWLRIEVPRAWNRYTPPFDSEVSNESERPPLARRASDENIGRFFQRAERNFLAWLTFGVGLYLLIWLGFILSLSGMDYLGVSSSFGDDQSMGGIVDHVIEFVKMLPMFGDLDAFSNLLRGRHIPEMILLNGPILFFAIALRNWAFQFEHLDYVIEEATLGRPVKYSIYLLHSIGAVLFMVLLLIITIAIQLGV